MYESPHGAHFAERPRESLSFYSRVSPWVGKNSPIDFGPLGDRT